MARVCPACGSAARADAKFCDECGAALGTGAGSRAAPVAQPGPAASGAERRIVSVLFADLVGFTALSEHRDAEEVRELLTRYFDACRALVTRYGGTVEKFIGDAVMAVWGAPVAHEDDAERAVRTALDLVDAVAMLGDEVGAPELSARAGVLTGEAAVTRGAETQGMVAGDLVNTAARIQAEAQPGTVLVGDATRLATEAALVFEDAGERTLKGKGEPVRVWRALRVVGGRRGAMKTEGLEAPFVGRDRELRLIKDLFHASADERRANLVSVVGFAGIGKSRLAWEFEKYIDGLADTMYWHRGRCLAYGEGVTYWALAEMVRMRARIAEAEDTHEARSKLQACLTDFIPDPEERRWAEPRLAQLLALEENASHERQDLFSAWRLFFERMAERQPAIMVFEDMQWADASLLDFIEYLLEWSRSHPLYVVTLARPDLMENHPTWGAGKRNFTSIFLEALAPSAMEHLLDGLVPGLPDKLRDQILLRAEGVPLYAVETVRMLLDKGLLERQGSVYRLTGEVADLAVPASLQGLIAARLDGLRPEARRILQDAAVLGKTFTLQSLAAVSGIAMDQLEPTLIELIHKEVLSLQADPRSPERGQYGFLQDLVKRVAYETMSKRDRKDKHLAVASWFEGAWGGDEMDVVEVVASHYLAAYRIAPQDPDAEDIKARAIDVLVRAAERAASLAANVEAERYFSEAAGLAADTPGEAELVERAGQAALAAGRNIAGAQAHLERAVALYDADGRSHAAARALARISLADAMTGRLDEAVQRMERAWAVVAEDPPDEDLALLAARLGSLLGFKGDVDTATARNEASLDMAEKLGLPGVLAYALNTKSMLVQRAGHGEESLALLTHALKLGVDNELPEAIIRSQFNLADRLCQVDRYAEALEHYESLLVTTRRVGERSSERGTLSEKVHALVQVGRWDEALETATHISEEEIRDTPNDVLSMLFLAEVYLHRGDAEHMRELVDMFASLASSDDRQALSAYQVCHAVALRAQGQYADALAEAEAAMTTALSFGGPLHQSSKAAFEHACEAAFALGDLATVERLLDFEAALMPGQRSSSVHANAQRFRARLGTAPGAGPRVDAGFDEAVQLFTQTGMAFRAAVAQLEYAEWLTANGQPMRTPVLADQAAAVFTRLRALPWIERAGRLAPAASAAVAS